MKENKVRSNGDRRNGSQIKASERLAREVAGKLLKRKSETGNVLPSESEMAALYGVGRSTVRESLRVLEGWGIVTMKAGRYGGPVANSPSSGDLGTHMGVVLQFAGASLLNVFDARMALDCLVARRAAEEITDESLGQLGESLHALGQSVDNHDSFFEKNLNFYDVFVESCQNIALKVLLRAYRDMTFDIIRELKYPSRWRSSVLDCRRKLFRAIAARNADNAEREMQRYYDAMRGYWLKEYPTLFRRPIDAVGTGKDSSQRTKKVASSGKRRIALAG